MKTLNPRWARLQELFNQAADLTQAERVGFLDRECGDDKALRKELDELLAADAGPPSDVQSGLKASLLTRSISSAVARTSEERRNALIGTVVGAYRLTAVVGHGGAGAVYLGERADRQYSAKVAVKIVENSLFNDEVARRFSAERQILANLNHPNIARLLDAGETRNGHPYLVMEYIHGEPIDRFCDARKLNIRQRLELFLQVCSAVQYAHQNLIVHRDLKPGNILVAPDGTPKLLDFGIAKLMDASTRAAAQAAAEASLTRANDRLLTPEYASPEQILGQNVTTASDVYALGIVLFELLTGSRPYQVHGLTQLELERVICIIDPPRPSHLLSQLTQADQSSLITNSDGIARSRSTNTQRLIKQLRGDLDAILLRALRKEPGQRYRSIEHFVDDLKRHLNQEPVEAREGNWLYYSKRFVRRHALGVTSGVAALIALVSFTIALTVQNQRIAEQRDRATQQQLRAETVSEFMTNVFENSDPFTSQGKEVTAKQLLDQAGQRINEDENLTQQPEVKARLLEAIGRSYQRQNLGDSAIKYLEDSIRLQRKYAGQEIDALPTTLNYLGVAQREVGRYSEASTSLNEAKLQLEKLQKTKSQAYIQVLADIGRLEIYRSNSSAALQSFEQALKLSRELNGNVHPETASVLNNYAQALLWRGRIQDAVVSQREANNIFRVTLPDSHPDRATSDYLLGDLLIRQGHYTEALPLITSALKVQEALYSHDNIVVANSIDTLSLVQMGLGQFDDAEQSAREALRITEKALGADNINTAYSRSALSDLLIKRRKYKEAEAEARKAMAILEKTSNTQHQYMASAEYLLAMALFGQNRIDPAQTVLRRNVARWREMPDAPAWRRARSENLLGDVLMSSGKTVEGASLLSESYQVLQSSGTGVSKEILTEARERLQRHGIPLQS